MPDSHPPAPGPVCASARLSPPRALPRVSQSDLLPFKLGVPELINLRLFIPNRRIIVFSIRRSGRLRGGGSDVFFFYGLSRRRRVRALPALVCRNRGMRTDASGAYTYPPSLPFPSLPFLPSFVRLFVRLFVRSFVRSFARLPACFLAFLLSFPYPRLSVLSQRHSCVMGAQCECWLSGLIPAFYAIVLHHALLHKEIGC